MAEKKKDYGYIGAVPSAGAAVVKAPCAKLVRKNPVVRRGGDLRIGKGGKV